MDVIPLLVGARVGLLILCVAVASSHIWKWRQGQIVARWRWAGDLFFLVTTGLLWTPVSLANAYVAGFVNPPIVRALGTFGYVGTVMCWAVSYALNGGGGKRGAVCVTIAFSAIMGLSIGGAYLFGAPQ